ncbi:MAG: hypothetical protein QM820_47870 [Minicystis sp.]
MLRALPALSLAALALAAVACPAPEPHTPSGAGAAGTTPSAGPAASWKPKNFARAADQGCNQLWSCDCSALVARAGCRLEGTRDDSTTGVCAADSGPTTACTRCMALPPAPACACKEVCP